MTRDEQVVRSVLEQRAPQDTNRDVAVAVMRALHAAWRRDPARISWDIIEDQPEPKQPYTVWHVSVWRPDGPFLEGPGAFHSLRDAADWGHRQADQVEVRDRDGNFVPIEEYDGL